MPVVRDNQYQKQAREEAGLWDKAAKDELAKMDPDYKNYQKTDAYRIYRHKYVLKMLGNIEQGDKVLELGCYNGWFTLEMARKGAHVDAHDISSRAIQIAKDYYQNRKQKEKFKGSISYFVTDLNFPTFPANSYDYVVIRNVLHHLINLEDLFKKINKSLKNDGKILVDDAIPSGKLEALTSGALLFLLPTDIPYKDKLKRVFKKGQILKRTQGLMDACGASPFEGISGSESIEYLKNNYKVQKFIPFASFVGTIAAHLKMKDFLKYPTLKALNLLDIALTKTKILKGSGYYLDVFKK
jgi:2-polyprenyl-3-methyl-5-hydroxy-6-metoxy-1,4-benzoquinol methylase